MRLSHGSSALSATFDDPNLVSAGGLAPVVRLAESCRLGDLVADKLTLKDPGGVNAQLKVPALVAGKLASDCWRTCSIFIPAAYSERRKIA